MFSINGLDYKYKCSMIIINKENVFIPWRKIPYCHFGDDYQSKWKPARRILAVLQARGGCIRY